jgi:hypothetical protein
MASAALQLNTRMGQGKITAPLSSNFNVLFAFRHSQPAGTTLTSYWGSRKYVAESGTVNLPGPYEDVVLKRCG